MPEETPTREVEVSTALLSRIAANEIAEAGGFATLGDEITEPRGISTAMARMERARTERLPFDSDFPTLRPPARPERRTGPTRRKRRGQP